ncbi:MAG: PUA domain-containing protein, partial [Pseudomonadota bacterium]
NPLKGLENGEAATWFMPQTDPQTARKGWIRSMKPRGGLTLDDGAVRALHQGRSLLPAGVTIVEGSFQRGDPVSVFGPDGAALGQGLTRYTADEARAIAGKRSDAIAQILGYAGRSVLIHRDDLAL